MSLRRHFLLFLLLSAIPAMAAVHAVVPTTMCANNGNGANWSCAASSGAAGAFRGVPGTLIRGDIYYLADGNYGTYTFGTTNSGSLESELRKGQSYDFGGMTGWNTATMGSGQAAFIGDPAIQMNTDFPTLNGNGTYAGIGCGGGVGATVTSSVPNPSDCGIKLSGSGNTTSGATNIVNFYNGSRGVNNVTMKYVELVGSGTNNVGGNGTLEIFGFGGANATILHSTMRNSGCVYIQDLGDNSTVNFNYFWGTEVYGAPGAACHGQSEFIGGGTNGGVRAYNIQRDIVGTAVWTVAGNGSGTANNWKFYGNIIWYSTPLPGWVTGAGFGPLANGTWACINTSVFCTNWLIYQNVIANVPSGGVPGLLAENAGSYIIRNNIFYLDVRGVSFDGSSITQDHNSFLGSTTSCPSGATNVCNNASPNPFTNWPSGNFTLASDGVNWNSRVALGAPYDTDVAGSTFTTDRGAFQFSGAGAVPAVTLNPASLSFANQIVGSSSASQALTLTNTGTATLNTASLSIVGANAGDFAQGGTCGSTLGASLSCAINVIFTPTTIGARTASVRIVDDASGSPHTAGLTGAGIAPIVSLVPPSLSFSNQAIGTSSPSQVITLTNTGNALMTLTSIVATGDYSRTTTCGASLAIGANCTITVTFTPTAQGTRMGAITIVDNAPGSPHVAGLTGTAFNPGVVIFGSGVELSGGMTLTVAPSVLLPNMGIVPASLAFGSVALGNISTLPLVVTNTGTAQLNIAGILVADSTNYSQTNNCTTLAPAASCTINVTFAPQSAATLNTTLTITANDAGSPHVVNLSGTGTAVSGDLPLPTFSPTVLSLPNVFVNPMAPFSQIIQQTIFIGNSTCPTAPARTNYKGQSKSATVCDYIDADGTGNQTVMTDWCAAADQRWDVVWTHGSSFNSGSSPWTWCDKYNGTQTTQFIVFHSDTPNPRGRMVCSHGLQDVLTPPLPDAGQRNHGCAGFLGMPDTTAPTPITNAAYTFDASYNDLANMITLTSTAVSSGGTVIAMGAASTVGSTFSDCGVSGTGVCPTDGVNHIVVQDARLMPASSVTTSIVVASVKTPGWFGGANVLPAHDIAAATHDVGFDEDYFTADGDDDGFGNNSITGLMQLACRSCWFNHNYLDGDKRDGSENHALNLSDSPGPVMVVHNYIEGASIGLWGGGGAPPAVSGLITTNVERRRNKVTYLGRWLPTPAGMQTISKTVTGGSCSGGNTLSVTATNTGSAIISNLVVYMRGVKTGVGGTVIVADGWYAATSVTASTISVTTACTNGTIGVGKVYGFASNVVVTSAAAMNAKAVKDPIDNNPVAKNRSENKEGLRTVIDGEIMENCGADGQAGFCLLISVRNSSGTPGSEIFQISDFVVTNTILRHGNQAIQISPRSGNVNYVNWPITNIACAGDGNSAAITATGMNNGLAILQSTQTVYGQDIYLTGIGNGAGSGLPLLSTGFYATQYPTNGNYGNDAVVTVLGTGICPASDTTTTGTVYGPGSFNGGGVTLPGHRYVFQNVLAYDFGDHSKWDGGGATTLLQNGAGGNNFTVGLTVTQVSPVVIVNAVDLAISSCPISQICPKVLQASTGDLAYVQCPNDSRFSSGAPGAEGVPMLSVAGDQLSFTYTPQNGSPALAVGNTATCSIKTPDSSVDSGYFNNQSFPWPFYWNHNTAVGVNNFVIAPGGGSFVKNAVFQNSLQLVPGATEIAPANTSPAGGGFRCNNSDKYSATDATGVTFCNDRSSLTYQRYVMTTRSIANNPNFVAGVICGAVPCSQDPTVNPNTNSVPGMVSTPGAIVTCGGVACDATHFLPDSVGFLGSMSTTTFPLNLPDFRNYVLHPSSPYRAGGILQSSDAKDQGVQMSQLINAQNRTLYPCALPCGAGPFRDGPQYGFLVWTASSDPALINYRVYRDGGVSPAATVTTTFYTDYGLSAGAHTWQVKAWNGTVESSVNGLSNTTY